MNSDQTDFATLEQSGWTDLGTARAYASDFATTTQQAVPALIAGAKIAPGRRALDLCCGNGNVAEAMVAAGARVIGVDFSPAMLEMATARVPGAEFQQGDAMALRFDAGRFDGVVVGFGLLHLPDPHAALAEVRRVLKPGGWLAYSVWQENSASALAYLFGSVAAHGDPDIVLPPGPDMFEFARPEQAYPALAAAGFGDMSMTVIDSGWQDDDPGAAFDYFLEGTVRGAALLRPQSPERQRRIRAAIADIVRENHAKDGGYLLPMPAVVVAARAV